MSAPQDLSRARAAFDHAAEACKQPQADLAEARQQLADRTADLEAAKDERRRAEDRYDAEPSSETYAAFVDTGNRVTAKEFLVSRTRERVAKLQPVASAADAAKTAAQHALRAAEAAAEVEAPTQKPAPTIDRKFAERQAAMGNEYAQHLLEIEHMPVINGVAASAPSPISSLTKRVPSPTPDPAAVERAHAVNAGLRSGDLFQAQATLRAAGVPEAEIRNRGLRTQVLVDR